MGKHNEVYMSHRIAGLSARCTLFLAAFAQGCSCCGSHSHTYDISGDSKHPHKNVPHDVYVTWRNYDGIDPNPCHYYVNGTQVGVGPVGFGKVLSYLREMPRGTRVLVFPMYPYGDLAPSSPYVFYPFQDQKRLLTNVCDARDLQVYYSDYDNNGDLVVPGSERTP
jgi:hypothetical protein